MKRVGTIALACLMAVGCGGDEEDVGDQALWEQVFGTWDCTANGRTAFSFKVVRKSEFGSDADWIDGDSQATGAASVTETQLYLKGGDGKAFRNFEYKVQVSEVLHHLDEWSLTANGQAPYACFKR